MTWQEISQAAESNWRSVNGGFTAAKRGIVQMPDGTKLFIKQAVDEGTQEWLSQELHAYHWLHQHRYKHMLPIIAEADDASGFALDDVSDWDWEDAWDVPKANAVFAALDELATLSEHAAEAFQPTNFGGDLSLELPVSAKAYEDIVHDQATLDALQAILGDAATRKEYDRLVETKPWSGNDLVHYDARSDNFAFNRQTGEGVLVDWNWAGLGSRHFDCASLLVNMQLRGLDVLTHYRERLDKASLAWLASFWLRHALGPRDTEGLRRLRPQQIKSALVAHNLYSTIV